MKSLRLWISLLLPAVLLSACSSVPKVNSQAKPGTDFSRYHTFSMIPLPVSGPASDPGLMLRIADPARQAVSESLAAKGFTETNGAPADLSVRLRLDSEPRTKIIDWGYASAPMYGPWGGFYGSMGYRNVDVYTYDERTLTVEIFDTQSKDLVWVGWSKRQANGPIQAEKLQAGIRAILATFPPGSTNATSTR